MVKLRNIKFNFILFCVQVKLYSLFTHLYFIQTKKISFIIVKIRHEGEGHSLRSVRTKVVAGAVAFLNQSEVSTGVVDVPSSSINPQLDRQQQNPSKR